ncbi:unnamed protein product [Caenorhabditis bovis]|uniref:Uncharacterized protein n=1 Tax=Caenorhabditis bovis TaxID=2654633 RepID=A0A8S1F3R5_9PELO|nr:unnamed protein product [Caenorhabditis bovis]
MLLNLVAYSSLLHLVSATIFYFKVHLICPRINGTNLSYHFAVSHFEKDIFSPDDDMSKPILGETNKTEHWFYQYGSQKDDGLFNNYFEPYIHVLHNCTNDGMSQTKTQFADSVAVLETVVTVKYVVYLPY